MSDEAAGARRARFWRRAFALLIDTILVSFVLAVAGLILFGPTNGRIRVSSTLIYSTNCEAPDARQLAEARAALPEDFHATSAARCTKTILGYVFDRTLFVEEVKQSGIVISKRGASFATDRDGHVVDAFYLDNFWFVLFAAYLVILEWRVGYTLGKDLMGIRVRSLSSDSISLAQAAKRFVVRFLPVVCLTIVFSFSSLAWAIVSSTLGMLANGLIVTGLGLAILINFIFAVRRDQLPWHDRFAGTEVVPTTSVSPGDQVGRAGPPSV